MDGLLKIHSPDNKRALLPHNEKKEGCNIDSAKQEKENEKCFKAGTVTHTFGKTVSSGDDRYI